MDLTEQGILNTNRVSLSAIREISGFRESFTKMPSDPSVQRNALSQVNNLVDSPATPVLDLGHGRRNRMAPDLDGSGPLLLRS